MANRQVGVGVRWWALLTAVQFLVGCKSGDSTSATCQQGDEGCPCYGNQTCDEGLSCRSDRCVDIGTAGSSGSKGGVAGTAAGVARGGSAATAGDTGNPSTNGGSSLTSAGTSSGGSSNAAGAAAAVGGVGNAGAATAAGGLGNGGAALAAGGLGNGGTAPATGGFGNGGASNTGGTVGTAGAAGSSNYQFKAKAIAAGKAHACAVSIDGTVRCWGANYAGQLGDASGVTQPRPVAVPNINNAIGVAAGDTHSCAVLSTGGVKCWGANQVGQLGNNARETVRILPVDVAGVTTAVGVTVGQNHTCVQLGNGTVQCWGLNVGNQLGYVTTDTYSQVPTALAGLTNVASMSTGAAHGCARLDDSTVKCWGGNGVGNVGIQPLSNDPSTTMVAPPVAVPGLTGVKAIAVGGASSCAVLDSGAMKCWGDNHYGQLGLVLNYTSYEPMSVTGMATASQATVGDLHACALLQNSTVSCWGNNNKGQLGSATTDLTIEAPIAVPGLSGVVAIDGGTEFTCALLDRGDVKCWGNNYYGQLGNGTKVDSSTPVTVVPGAAPNLGAAGPIPNLVRELSAGQSHTCALWDDGRAKCWGKNDFSQLGSYGDYQAQALYVREAPLGIVGIDMGDLHSCAVTKDGAAYCWGHNSRGQLGDGTTSQQYTPTPVWHLFEPMKYIAAGGGFTCGLLASGKVVCWGGSAIGDGYATERHTPTEVLDLTGAVDVQAGADHACALLGDGRVFCWGANAYGQLGDGTNTTRLAPVQVYGITTAAKLGKGFARHSCVVLNDGTVKCWGLNTSGQLGDGTKVNQPLPVTVTGLTGIQSVVTGGTHSCALSTDNSMRCWGANDISQLGDATTTARTGLVTVYENPKVLTMTAGSRHTCALYGNYQVYCWGANVNGETASMDNQANGGRIPHAIWQAE